MESLNNTYKIYKGSNELVTFREVASISNTQGYQPSKELINAVNVAILLGKPLLVTGEPGTGKTLLAESIANEIKLNGAPLPYFEFVAKTTSKAKDLLYRYDSIGHLRQANLAKSGSKNALPNRELNENEATKKERLKGEYKEFIQLNALGAAIKKAQDEEQRCVVLIDEIDKAPRDFPNDILREIEKLSFTILETTETITAKKEYKPIIIITSNAERLLPDAFLRRCVFFHIEFPDRALLKQIVLGRLEKYKEGKEVKQLTFNTEQLNWIINHFYDIRAWCRKKKPATAEFLSWVQILDKFQFNAPATTEVETSSKAQFNNLSAADKDLLVLSYAVLAKHENDFETLKGNLSNA